MSYQTTVIRKPCNHALHLVLTLFTFGMWLPVWIIAAMTGRKETQSTQVQAGWGQPQRQYQWNPYKGEWQ